MGLRNIGVYGLCQLSGVLKKTREHNFSETVSESVTKNSGILSDIRDHHSYLESTECDFFTLLKRFHIYLPYYILHVQFYLIKMSEQTPETGGKNVSWTVVIWQVI